MSKIINFLVNNYDHNQRIDIILNKKEKSLSRNRIKNLIIDEKLKINGTIVCNPSKKVNLGDKLSLIIPDPKVTSIKPYNFKLKIVYEDEDLLIIDKPAGIIMHPGAGNYNETVVNALINYNPKNLSNIGDELRPGIVHRIDKNTSGLVVIAKNNQAHENLSKQFSKHTIEREYQLLIWGKLRPSFGRIETFIKRSSRNRQLMEVSQSKGKKAITNYRLLKFLKIKKFQLLV